MEFDAERRGQGLGVLQAVVGGKPRGHGHAKHVFRAQGVGGDHRRQRRIDAPGQPDGHAREAGLAHVVPGAEHQRPVDFLHIVEQRRDGRGRKRGARAAGHRGKRHMGGTGLELRLPFAAARVEQPPPRGQPRVQFAQHHVLGELPAPGEQRPVGPEHHAVAVENQLVLAADHVGVGHERAVVRGARGEHPLPGRALGLVVGRGGNIDEQPRATAMRLFRRRPARIPDVLAHAYAKDEAVPVEDRAAPAGGEIAVLVEDPVIGQVALGHDAGHGPVVRDHGRILQVAFQPRAAEDGRQSPALQGEFPSPLHARGHEIGLNQQILGRIAREHHLRENDKLRSGLARRRDARQHLAGIAADVPHRGI